MTTTLDREESSAFAPSAVARLSLTPKTTLAGQLDGAWWPRSRDLEAELTPLTDALAEPWGRITHVTVNPARWPVIPHKVPVTGHTVHVGWFTEQDPDKMILLSYTVGRWDLLVIPPETDPAAAARLMTASAIPGSVLKASGVLAADDAMSSALDAQSREDDWESEGGSYDSLLGHPLGHRSSTPPPGAGK